MYEVTYSDSYIYMAAFIIFIEVLLFVRIRMTEGAGKEESWIMKMILSGIATAGVDILCVLVGNAWGNGVFYLMNTGYYAFYFYVMLLLFQFTFEKYSPVSVSKTLMQIIVGLPIQFMFIMSILSYWTRWFYYVDEDGVFHKGEGWFVFFGIGSLYIIGTMVISVIYMIRHSDKEREAAQPFFYAFPLILGPLIQVEAPSQPWTLFGLLVSLLFIFMNNQEIVIRRSMRDITSAERKIDAFSAVYYGAWEIDVRQRKVTIVRAEQKILDILKKGGMDESCDLDFITNYFFENFVDPSSQEKLKKAFRMEEVIKKLRDRKEITFEYKGRINEWCRVVFVPEMKDEEGTVTHILCGVQEITDEKMRELEQKAALEKALEDTRRAEAAKSEFLSKMSHDIRTPLNGIIGLMDINEKHKDEPEIVNQNRKKAKMTADHLLSLINDVLDMSKLETDSVVFVNEPVDLYGVMAEVITISSIKADERNIRIRHDAGAIDKKRYVYGSRLHIKQLFLNLLSNSVKYNVDGGSIDCQSDIVEENGEYVTYRFTIEDTGIGMSEEFLQHIFEPFTQEKQDARSFYQGTGLGMAIVKEIVDRMNGTISVESTKGKGSRFTITIPFKISREIPKQVYVEEQSNEESLAGIRILLAEDNELNMEIAKCILEDAGADVVVTENGELAYSVFMENDLYYFDVILMDIMMPVLDGYSATRKIRNSFREDGENIPIIAMSANAFAEDVEMAGQAGMDDHIAKPVDSRRLISMIRRYVNKKEL